MRLDGFGAQDLKQAIGERGRLEHRFEEQEAAAGVLVVGQGEERLTELGVAAKRSAPPMSQRSSLSSMVRRSESSSAW